MRKSTRIFWGSSGVNRATSLTPLVFPVLRIPKKLWGGPPLGKATARANARAKGYLPGPALANRVSLIHNGQAGQGPAADRGSAPQWEKRAAWPTQTSA